MAPHQHNGNALRRIMADPQLAGLGIATELAGIRTLKITRNGRFLGIWRHAVGSFDWYPAGYNQPQLRLPTPDHVTHYMATALGSVNA